VNAVYHGFAWMPEIEASGYDESDRQQEMDRVEEMNLHIARTWYRPDWAGGENGISASFDWDSPKMEAFYKWIGEMKERGVEVALQAAWGFPADTHLGREHADPETDPLRYARWVSESVRQIVQVRGFDNVRYLVLMTEPTTSPWGKAPDDWELWPYYVKVMRTVHDQMKLDKTRELVSFVGPNNHAVGSFGQLRLSEAVKELEDVLDIYGAHTYLPPENAYENWRAFMDRVREAVDSEPKPIWLDEYNVFREWETHIRDQPEHGTYLAEVVAASLDARIQTTMIWLLFDQLYTAPAHEATNGNSFYKGVHRWGTVRWPHDDLEDASKPYPAWYAYSMLSRYLGGGEGSKVYESEGQHGLHINAVRQKDGSLSLLVINSNASEKAFRVQLSKSLHCKLERHLYDPARISPGKDAAIPGVDRIFGHVEDEFTDTLPAGAVAVYVSKNPADGVISRN
ncbi:MAG: hypothetical protein GY790_17325, partial [Bacteroidetes bacterium]|nr:hypothetical protein [Bacteroidota bacterium]